ncbi:hypothetical protein ABH922_002855 [Rhodococcus sp. 27YEA15]
MQQQSRMLARTLCPQRTGRRGTATTALLSPKQSTTLRPTIASESLAPCELAPGGDSSAQRRTSNRDGSPILH